MELDQQLVNLMQVKIELSERVDRYSMQILMSQTSAEYAQYSEPKSIEDAWARSGKQKGRNGVEPVMRK